MKYIFGRKPVLEAIKAGQELEQILIPFGAKGAFYNELKAAAKKNKLKISEVPSQKLDQMSKGQNSQGVIATIPSFEYRDIDEIISEAKSSQYPLLLLLDSIQDTHNLGAILRTAECFGVDGILMTIHQSAPVTGIVEKTSAGAVNHLKIAKVTNLNREIQKLKDEGFWIVGSSLENSQDYSKIDYKMPIAVIVGNEEKGIRKLVADNCDFLVQIPMQGKIQSLNVSVASGILLAEIAKQRKL